MASPDPADITRLLEDWAKGDRGALDELTPLVWGELRRIAARRMANEGAGHTLQATALVNEAFLRLAGNAPGSWESRNHFYAVCAQVMRHILTDHARSRNRDKRGGGALHVALDDAAAVAAAAENLDLLELSDALERLEAFDPQKGRIVELRFFAGLGIEETANVLGVSAMTVRREWTRAKAWLYRALHEGAVH